MRVFMIGQRLKHYEIQELLGRGGMGVVYKARDVRLGRPVALKVLKEEIAAVPDRKKRFIQEARSASVISHPSVAQVFDVDEVEGKLFIALEFVEGRTVRQLIADREIDLLGAIDLAIQVAEGLTEAHARGIIHRDIKSDNVMVTRDGRVKILDFGLAKLVAASEDSQASIAETMAQTQAGTVLGTVAYMSPEQARGKNVDHRSDLFSVGVVLYEMVLGELPFQGQSPLDTMHAIAFEEVRPVTVVRRDLPADLQRILTRCLRKRADDRYQDAKELIDDLQRLKRDLESGSIRPLSLREKLQDSLEWLRFSLPIGVGGGLLAIAVIALVGYLLISAADVGSVVLVLLIGLPVYRFVRNRKARMLRRLVAKVSRFPEVKAIIVRDSQVTVVIDKARAELYIRTNSLLESLNQKLFYGEPLEVSIRDDLDAERINTLLREPGIRYIREGLLEEGLPLLPENPVPVEHLPKR